ncbi:hypothetical protein [Nocardiopsis nanhaiensis]
MDVDPGSAGLKGPMAAQGARPGEPGLDHTQVPAPGGQIDH